MHFKRAFAALPLAILFFMASALIPAGSSILEGSLNSIVYAEEQFINQSASTSGGTVNRYIDISSSGSHGYLHEDMTVVGKASITESFTMNNMSPGSEAGSGIDDWDIYPSGTSASNTSSGSSESSTVAAEEKANPPEEAVLGISIVSYPSWLDLF